jgi:hypothetical protein
MSGFCQFLQRHDGDGTLLTSQKRRRLPSGHHGRNGGTSRPRLADAFVVLDAGEVHSSAREEFRDDRVRRLLAV